MSGYRAVFIGRTSQTPHKLRVALWDQPGSGLRLNAISHSTNKAAPRWRRGETHTGGPGGKEVSVPTATLFPPLVRRPSQFLSVLPLIVDTVATRSELHVLVLRVRESPVALRDHNRAVERTRSLTFQNLHLRC